jgi:hypothetical protein
MRALTCLNLLFSFLLIQQMAHLVTLSLKLSYTTVNCTVWLRKYTIIIIIIIIFAL